MGAHDNVPSGRRYVFSYVLILLLASLISWSSQSFVGQDRSARQLATYRYTSSPLGFEVDLPADWKVNEYRNVGFGFSFLSPGQVFDDDGKLLKGAYATAWVSQSVSDPTTLTPPQARASGRWLTVGEKPAVKYVPMSPDRDSQVVVDVYRDDTLYRFTLHFHAQDPQWKTYEAHFDRILQSLAFIARDGDLPIKEVTVPPAMLAHPALDFPFTAGVDWRVADGGGYHNQYMHEGYAHYALDFERSDRDMADELALAPTSGVLSHKETTASKCIDVSIDQVSSTDDLYLQICHVVWESYLENGSSLQKAQVLGRVALAGEPGFVNIPHIHIAPFIGKKGNPWTDPNSITGVPFVAEYNLRLSGRSFYPDGTTNQFGGTCCYQSAIGPICPASVTSRATSEVALSDICSPGSTPTPAPGPTSTPVPPTPAPGDGIELCDGTNYGSPCQVFTEGRYPDLAGYGWYDRAESVRFRGSYRGNYHVVLLTETNFGGNPYHADDDVPDLGDAHRNRIRSLDIYRTQQPTPTPPSDGGIELCDGTNYGSPCQVFTEGRYSNLADYGWYDRAESVRFRGSYRGNYHVVLLTETNFGGNPYHADDDVPDLGDAHRNRIRSLNIYFKQPPPTSTPTSIPSPTPTPTRTPPDLVPYQGLDWEDPVVPSSVPGTHSVNTLYAGQPTYFDWGVKNQGETAASDTFYVSMYIDGVRRIHYAFEGLDPSAWIEFLDWSEIVDVPGWHTVRIEADSTDVIVEGTEGNNAWERDFYWEAIDTPTPTPSHTPTSTATRTPTHTPTPFPVSLSPGWNHIALPLNPTDPYTAQSLIDDVNSQGGDVEEICRWHAGGWECRINGLPFNDFPIELYKGYFLRSNKASTWTVHGQEVTSIHLELQPGWNSIGVPSDGYTAESLCQAINDQGGEVEEMGRWYNGGWEGHICGLPFNDFPIERGKGYFVKATRASSVWLPAEEDPTPTAATPTSSPSATPTTIPTPTATSTPTPTPTATPMETPIACVPPPASLVSWWPGDGNANDIVEGNHGTLQDGVTFGPGLVGQAFSFDGVDDLVQTSTTGLPTGNSDRTLELWVRIESLVAGEAFFAGYGSFGSYEQTYHLGTSGSTLFFSQWGNAVWGPSLEIGRWYHVAVTNAGDAVTLYLDGTAVASGTLSIATPSNTQFYMGRIDDGRRLHGLADEVGIYNRALNSSEIATIFNAGSAGKCKN